MKSNKKRLAVLASVVLAVLLIGSMTACEIFIPVDEDQAAEAYLISVSLYLLGDVSGLTVDNPIISGRREWLYTLEDVDVRPIVEEWREYFDSSNTYSYYWTQDFTVASGTVSEIRYDDSTRIRASLELRGGSVMQLEYDFEIADNDNYGGLPFTVTANYKEVTITRLALDGLLGD